MTVMADDLEDELRRSFEALEDFIWLLNARNQDAKEILEDVQPDFIVGK